MTTNTILLLIGVIALAVLIALVAQSIYIHEKEKRKQLRKIQFLLEAILSFFVDNEEEIDENEGAENGRF